MMVTQTKAALDKIFNQMWYQPRVCHCLLVFIPLSIFFSWVVRFRRFIYAKAWLRSYRSPVPLIVVGNLTLGGTGKTPLIIQLVHFFKDQGFNPGVVSRGYRRKSRGIISVGDFDDPFWVGDEPFLIHQKTKCPVVVGNNRVKAVQAILKKGVDLILSDDGLQHYRLQRDVEILVLDGKRRFGNEYCLPVGPLREPLSRLKSVDFKMVNGIALNNDEYSMLPVTKDLYLIKNPNEKGSLAQFYGRTVHAVAGIAHPERFFELLKDHPITVIPHVFSDHHFFCEKDIDFYDPLPIIMTEKDAVKCKEFSRDVWVLPIEMDLPISFKKALLSRMYKFKSR